MDVDAVAVSWDDEYRKGRYADAAPLPFVATIASTLRAHPAAWAGVGLYVGCGNGRNYLPLVDLGLTLYGLDLSPEAIGHMVRQRPEQKERLIVGDFQRFERLAALSYLIAIQVFQHGGEAEAALYFSRVPALLRPGGLFFLRVNSASTEVYHRHTVVERNPLDGFTVRYEDGPKRGLRIHFYSLAELEARTRGTLVPLMAPREDVIQRAPPETGCWAQWEAIWQRPA